MPSKSVPDINLSTFLRKVSSQKTAQEYRNDQAIFSQGDTADAMFCIASGNVKLTVSSKRGKKAVIGILRRGDFFGECCFAGRALRTSTATAIHQSTIWRVTKPTLIRAIHKDPAFSRLFVLHLLSRIGRIQEDLVDQLFSSSEKRLARILWLMADSGQSPNSEPSTLKVTQETLAQMTGTTRSRVSYFMNRFRKMSLIDYNGSLQVNRALLAFLLQA
jgi:CRP/FNR family transcriptional regulator, cyclic AMP receptor protein